jgi:hypothetical protein
VTDSVAVSRSPSLGLVARSMAFRRDVPALEQMLLKFISKSGRLAGEIVNERTLARAHRVGRPGKSRTHRVKQEVIRALLQAGRLADDTLPDSFFHESMTRLEIIGGKISTPFIERVRAGGWRCCHRPVSGC